MLPEPARTASGYRDYPSGAQDVVRFVRSAQAVGLSLGEIREILGYRDRGETPCAHVVDLIRRRATAIDEQMDALKRTRRELRRLSRRARDLRAEDCAPTSVCHVIPRR